MKNGRGGSSIVSVYTVSPLKGLPVCWGRPQTVDHCRDHYLFTTSPKYKIKELFRAPYYGQIIQNAVALTLGQCEKLWQIQTSEVLGYLTECALNAKSIALNSKTWVNLLVRKVGIELLEAYQLLKYQKICRVLKNLQSAIAREAKINFMLYQNPKKEFLWNGGKIWGIINDDDQNDGLWFCSPRP